MPHCTVCNVCAKPGTLNDSPERQQVPCNVFAYRDNSFTVWRCGNCRSLHCADDADLAFYYSDYPWHRSEFAELSYATTIGCNNRLSVLTDDGIDASHRILDFGCGAGIFVKYLRQKGYREAYGYDPYVPAYSDSSLLDGRYDAVVTWDVIEHVDEPREFFRSLTALLKPGGLLVIGTPNASGIPLNAADPLHIPELHQPYHRHILSDRALRELGHEHGLKVCSHVRRSYLDSPYPFVNTPFLWSYIVKRGGYTDALSVEWSQKVSPYPRGLFVRSPMLLVKAFFGYCFVGGSNMIMTFRRQTEQTYP